MPVQRCTVHKHRNLFAHAPERLHDEITADYNDMIYAATREEIEARRKVFIRNGRLKHRAVADSLEGGRRPPLHLHPPAAKPMAQRPCTTNAIERLHEEFKLKDQDADRAAGCRYRRHAVLGPACLRQINMRKG